MMHNINVIKSYLVFGFAATVHAVRVGIVGDELVPGSKDTANRSAILREPMCTGDLASLDVTINARRYPGEVAPRAIHRSGEHPFLPMMSSVSGLRRDYMNIRYPHILLYSIDLKDRILSAVALKNLF